MTIALLVSLISGGLAGGIVSAISNRLFHWRSLRTSFYPKLNDMYSAYIIRFQNDEGRYWITTVGYNPADEDEKFVDHRSTFISELNAFNELKEARVLRRAILNNMLKAPAMAGEKSKLDLKPEADAINACLNVLHRKLNLDKS